MASAINPNSLPVNLTGTGSTPPPAKEETPQGPADQVTLSKPEGKKTRVLNARVVVPEELTVKDKDGNMPLNNYDVVVVPSADAAKFNPEYASDPLLEDPPQAGKVMVPTVIPVDVEVQQSADFQNYHAEYLSPKQAVVEQDGLNKEFQRGRDSVFPNGVPVLPMEDGRLQVPVSKEGESIRSKAEKFAGMGTQLGGQLVGYELATGIGFIGAQYSGMGALALGPLMAFKAYNSLGKIEDHEKYAEAAAKGGERVNLAVQPQLGEVVPSSTANKVEDLKFQFAQQKRNAWGQVGQGALLTAAGVASLMGGTFAPGIAALALGSTAVATTLNSKATLDQLKHRKAELEKLLAEGKQTYTEEVEIKALTTQQVQTKQGIQYQEVPVVRGTRQVELPIKPQLEAIDNSLRQTVAGGVQQLVMGGSPLAMALHAPLGMTLGLGGAISLGGMAVTGAMDAASLMKKKKELQELKNNGQTTFKELQVQNEVVQGQTMSLLNPVGCKEVDVVIDDRIKALDKAIDGALVKTTGFGAVAAGITMAQVAGMGFLAASGVLAVPAAVYTVGQLGEVRNLAHEKKELKALQAQGQTTYKKLVNMADDANNIVGAQEVDLPIEDRLKEISHSMRSAGFKATAAATVGGMAVAAACGVPLLLVAGGLAIPAAVGCALFPSEVWTKVKDVFSKIGDAFRSIGHKIASWFRGDKSDASKLSPAEKELQTTYKSIQGIDKDLAERLIDGAANLAVMPPPGDQQALVAYQESSTKYQAAMKELLEKDPALAQEWVQKSAAVQQEQQAKGIADKLPELQKAAEELRGSLSPADQQKLDGVIQGEFMQKAVLDSEPVQKALQETQLSRGKAEELANQLLLAQETQNNSELDYLGARVMNGDDDAKKEMMVAQSIQAVVQYYNQQAAAQQQQPAAEAKK